MTYILRRLVTQLIPVLFVASFLIFVSVRLIPGDPALGALGDSFSAVDPEVYEELRRQLGLDKPIYVQYPLWLGNVLTGDFGDSLTGLKVIDLIWNAVPASVELTAVAVSVGWFVAIMLGYIAGWRGGRTDTLIVRGVDTLLAFPGIILAIILITIMGAGIFPVAVAIAFFNIPAADRLARAGVLRDRERDYVLAGRCLGLPEWRILFRHVAPNTFGAFTVQVPLAIVASVLIMAALNFLGLGHELPNATLGSIMQEGRPFMREAPHFVLGPVVVLALLLTALNFLSDVLTERLDPVLRRRV